MNLPWLFQTWRELALVTVVAGLFLVKFPFPYQASSNFGLGAGWNCSYAGKSEPVCIKEVPKQ